MRTVAGAAGFSAVNAMAVGGDLWVYGTIEPDGAAEAASGKSCCHGRFPSDLKAGDVTDNVSNSDLQVTSYYEIQGLMR
jgi:hypothetical protein